MARAIGHGRRKAILRSRRAEDGIATTTRTSTYTSDRAREPGASDLVDRFMEDTPIDVDQSRRGRRVRRRHHGARRGGRCTFGRLLVRDAPDHDPQSATEADRRLHQAARPLCWRRRPDERAIRGAGRRRARDRVQSARLAHRPVHLQGDGRAAAKVATRVLLGESKGHAAQGLNSGHFSVKAPSSLSKFADVDPLLGPRCARRGGHGNRPPFAAPRQALQRRGRSFPSRKGLHLRLHRRSGPSCYIAAFADLGFEISASEVQPK